MSIEGSQETPVRPCNQILMEILGKLRLQKLISKIISRLEVVSSQLSFAKLRLFTGFMKANFFTLDFSGISGHEASRSQGHSET